MEEKNWIKADEGSISSLIKRKYSERAREVVKDFLDLENNLAGIFWRRT